MIDGLVVPAFMAGVLMFLAPCTLPLVPGYLAFVGGVPQVGGASDGSYRKKIFRNALFFVLGFSVVFITLGVLLGFAGSLIGPYRVLFSQIGGAIIILFGLMMLRVVTIPLFQKTFHPHIPSGLRVGTSSTSFVIGAIFSLGWTPCIGPILATIFLLAGSSGTMLSGAILLAVFSLGLGIPFLITAWGYGKASAYIARHERLFAAISTLGGVLFIFLGILLVINQFHLLVEWGFEMLRGVRYESIEQYL